MVAYALLALFLRCGDGVPAQGLHSWHSRVVTVRGCNVGVSHFQDAFTSDLEL